MFNMDESCWMYQGKKCLDEAPPGAIGFIYRIEFPNKNGEICYYIGKKVFQFSKKKKITKKVKKETGTKKRIERLKVESDWKDYFGSGTLLNNYIEKRGGTHGFKREILLFCEDQWSLTYREVEAQIKYNVLFDPYSWNITILNKFFKKVPIKE